LFISARALITSFENVIDGVFNDTIGVLQQAQRDAMALINSPIEIFKDSIENMAQTRVENVFGKIESEISSFRNVMDDVRGLIVDEEGYLSFTYTQADIDALTTL
jgi:hypothetical protein